MERLAALLRGVNVGGRRRLGMGDLVAVVEGLGHRDVATYLQSGNVVFTPGSRAAPGSVAARIEQALAVELDLESTVVVRSASELASVLAANPFAGADPATLHVTFLAAGAGAGGGEAGGPVDVEAKGDRGTVVGPHVYLHCPTGYGRSPLTNSYWERRLGVPVTTRNWRTVAALAELAGG